MVASGVAYPAQVSAAVTVKPMSTMTRPRGPLPARVYWTRRLLVLGLALGLVFGIGRLLGGGPAGDAGPSARPAAATASGSPSVQATTTVTTQASLPPGQTKGKGGKAAVPLAMPTGPCSDSDVMAEPVVKGNAYAGHDVAITLRLSTIESPACTWRVSPDAVVVRLTSGSDRIWTSQECPATVPEQDVVLRQATVAEVDVVWSGQRSDPTCSRTTQWAEPGSYHATAAALGAEPVDHQFELLPPPRPTITPSPTASPEEKQTEQD